MVHKLLFSRRTALVNDIKKSIMMLLPEDGSPVELENSDYQTVLLDTNYGYASGLIDGVRRSGDVFVIMATDQDSDSSVSLYSNQTDNIDDLLSVLRLLEREAGRSSMDLVASPKEERPAYQTIIVQFREPIAELNHYFDEIDPSVRSLKQWIDSYESSRFTQVGSHVAVITSEYNMECIKEWLTKNVAFAIIQEDGVC